MPAELTKRDCVPCRADTPRLSEAQTKELMLQIDAGWRNVDNHHLEREYRFNNFMQALDFVNKIGKVAEAQGHRPDLYFAWGKAKIILWTHKIDGLSENDFILAAKIDTMEM